MGTSIVSVTMSFKTHPLFGITSSGVLLARKHMQTIQMRRMLSISDNENFDDNVIDTCFSTHFNASRPGCLMVLDTVNSAKLSFEMENLIHIGNKRTHQNNMLATM